METINRRPPRLVIEGRLWSGRCEGRRGEGLERIVSFASVFCFASPFDPIYQSLPRRERVLTVRGFSDALPTRNGYGRRGRVQRIACLFWCRVQFTLLNYTDNVNNILRKLYLLVCLNYKSNANLFYPRLRTRNP